MTGSVHSGRLASWITHLFLDMAAEEIREQRTAGGDKDDDAADLVAEGGLGPFGRIFVCPQLLHLVFKAVMHCRGKDRLSFIRMLATACKLGAEFHADRFAASLSLPPTVACTDWLAMQCI